MKQLSVFFIKTLGCFKIQIYVEWVFFQDHTKTTVLFKEYNINSFREVPTAKSVEVNLLYCPLFNFYFKFLLLPVSDYSIDQIIIH